jgi:hypothetical protein
MATRIPISWLLFLAIFAVFAFFGYHILQAASAQSPAAAAHAADNHLEAHHMNMPHALHPSMEHHAGPAPDYMKQVPAIDAAGDEHEYVGQQGQPIPNNMPYVPGQSEEELRDTDQLQASPQSTQYDLPDATDPLQRVTHMNAEFGSNLRHPEQMIEMRPRAGVANIVASGLGSEASGPGPHRAVGYAPEMAQNGGEFMQGISAFDGSDDGVGYSML